MLLIPSHMLCLRIKVKDAWKSVPETYIYVAQLSMWHNTDPLAVPYSAQLRCTVLDNTYTKDWIWGGCFHSMLVLCTLRSAPDDFGEFANDCK